MFVFIKKILTKKLFMYYMNSAKCYYSITHLDNMFNLFMRNSHFGMIGVLILFFGTMSDASALTTKESCTTGVYSAYYASSCNVCGYTERFRINSPFDIVDWFHNTDGGEKLVSSSTSV